MVAVLQPGNQVEAVWRARLESHLGAYTVEPLAARAAYFLDRAAALHGVVSLCALLRLLPERDPHEELFEMADAIAALFGDIRAAEGAATMWREYRACAARRARLRARPQLLRANRRQDDLAYVSPKSGRAVSRAAGAPWRDKLLPYPDFLQHESIVAETGRSHRRVPVDRIFPDARRAQAAGRRAAGGARTLRRRSFARGVRKKRNASGIA